MFRPLTRNQPILLPGEKEATRGPELDGDLRVSGLTSVPSLNVKNNLTLSDITVINSVMLSVINIKHPFNF